MGVRVQAAARPREAAKECHSASNDDNRVIHVSAGQGRTFGSGSGWWWRVGLYAGFCIRTLRSGDGHPSRLTVTRPLLRPTRGLNGRAAHSLCSALLRVGFVEPPGSPPALVRSYRTVSPLPVRARRARHRRSVLCGTFLRVAPTGCYPAPCPVESGRSSAGSLAGPDAAIRPTRHRPHSAPAGPERMSPCDPSRQFGPSGPIA